MAIDKLQLFNTALVTRIAAMNDEELFNFLLENEERILFLTDFNNDSRPHINTHALILYRRDRERFREFFFEEIEEYREGVVFTIVQDFCFKDETVRLGYYAQGGYLDSPDSCDVKTSDDVMPPVDPESDAGWDKDFFHLLDARHLDNIIRALETNFDNQDENTREDIEKIKEMRDFCRANEGWNAAYIYSRF